MLSNEDQKFIMTGYGMITYFPDSKVWTITSDLGGSYFISYNNDEMMDAAGDIEERKADALTVPTR